jgi:hypothetical protein
MLALFDASKLDGPLSQASKRIWVSDLSPLNVRVP